MVNKTKDFNMKFEQHAFHLVDTSRKKRIINKDIVSIIAGHIINYPTPVNLNYF